MTSSRLRFPVALLAAAALQFGAVAALAQPTPDALPLDLTRFFHTNFFAPKYKGPGEAIPKGVQKFGGVPFQIVGQAGFYGQTLAERGQVWQPEAVGIVVGQPFAELHLLHHAFWPDTEGQEIATIRLNYADGSKQSLPIRYGHHVRDWFRLPSEPRETLADPNTVICWRGTHPGAEKLKATLRLFKSTLANPFPGKVVTTMDVVSTRQHSSYSLMAATVSGKDPGRAPASAVPPLEPEPDFTGAVRITVLDADTGKPIAGAKIDPGMDVDGAGVVGTPVITSASGEQTVQYRAGKTLSLYVTASADGYTKRAASWRTGEIPGAPARFRRPTRFNSRRAKISAAGCATKPALPFPARGSRSAARVRTVAMSRPAPVPRRTEAGGSPAPRARGR